MEFVYDDGRARSEYVLSAEPESKVADLARALGMPGAGLVVDGRLVAGTVGLRASGITVGSVVRPALFAVWKNTDDAAAGAALEARAVGGLDAGARLPLPVPDEGSVEFVVGRGDGADISLELRDVSRRHAALRVAPDGSVSVGDLGSRNGVDVDGTLIEHPAPVAAHEVIGIGNAALVQIVPAPAESERAMIDVVHGARHGWRVPFHRSARPTPPMPAALPVPADVDHARSPFLIAGLLGPLLLAGATMWLYGDPRFAVLALLGPVSLGLAGLEKKLRGSPARRRGRRAHQEELRAFRAGLEAEHVSAARRLREAGADPAEALWRAETPGARLWERRAHEPDFLRLSLGSGDQPWQPQLLGLAPGRAPSAQIAAELAAHAEVPRVPVTVDLAESPVLGLTGPRPAALAAARALLCQAAVLAGPSDLAIAVFSDSPYAADWDWAKWLPHVFDRTQGVVRWLATGRAETDRLAAELLQGHPFPAGDGTGRQGALFVVVDGAGLLEGRSCPLRELLADDRFRTRGLVLADPLPAVCAAVLTVASDGTGELRDVATGARRGAMLAAGLSESRARKAARALARFEDPEIAMAGAGLPERVSLFPLLDLPAATGEAVLARWRAGGRSLRARAVIGVGESGRYTVDLDEDGPHAMIAGATGSGKSELLRSLVLGLAVESDPDHLVFLLIDGKGGAAFEEFRVLPHVVGITTDLDQQLSVRALRCLEAELRRREELLRRAGVADHLSYQRWRDAARAADPAAPAPEPLPRMIVLVDEFAQLAKKVPTFIDALVDVAQRGRSLGVHLILAAQRPADAVNDAIKANVKLRIALRTESPEDSRAVIDTPAAYSIGPMQWGRAFRRVGGGEVQAVQTALAGAVTELRKRSTAVELRPFGFGTGVEAREQAQPDGAERTDVDTLAELLSAAYEAGGYAEPRRPWPEPLPPLVTLAELGAVADGGLQTQAVDLPAFLLADDPDGQRRLTLGWDPGAGNLLIFGAVGSGTTTALAAVLTAWGQAGEQGGQGARLFVFDHGAGALAPFAALPQTGGYAASGSREGQIRLVNLLVSELKRRQADPAGGHARWIVAVDGLASLRASFDEDPFLAALLPRLDQVYADGPSVGIVFAACVDRVGGAPGAWLARTAQRLLLGLAGPDEYASFSIRPERIPPRVPGRGLVAATGQEVQVALPELSPVQAAGGSVQCGGTLIRLMPRSFPASAMAAKPAFAGRPWRLPLGLAQESLAPAFLPLHEHDHVLIAGPRRSGRSTLLCRLGTLLADAAAAGEIDATIIAHAPRSSPLRELAGVLRAADYEESHRMIAACDPRRPPILLVDDADFVDDVGAYQALIDNRNPDVHVIAACRNDGPVRSGMHWLGSLRRGRTGVLLLPDWSVDGDLLGVTLPRRPLLEPAPGRGYLVADGGYLAVQTASEP
jgi:S-DNA-T family DNA segregation ATPase FtsK/SpoIIIE